MYFNDSEKNYSIFTIQLVILTKGIFENITSKFLATLCVNKLNQFVIFC